MKSTKFFILFIALLSCKRPQETNKIKILSGENCKFWDANIGYSMCLCKDLKYLEYEYEDSLRKEPDYSDLIIDNLNWKCVYDSLYIYTGKTIYNKYKILSINEERLVLCPFYKSWGADADTIFFFKSLNQTNKVIKRRVLSY